ncbi:hypothetical protein [Natronomonas amylolytica]|uniref:hypothetical protein n=1 Tax=Natronomonas amylolytica TaxID=3108498 RepID=UPI0030085E9E
MTVPAVRERLLGEHRPTLRRALACADAVAAGWDGESTDDRDAVAGPYETVLREAGLLESLLGALVEAMEFTGERLAAQPVADVPYVAVTAEGVVLRGPTPDGRVVVTLQAFERDPYRRGPDLPEALAVERRGT